MEIASNLVRAGCYFLLCLSSMYDNAAKITRSKVKTSSVFMGITLLYKLEGSIMIGHPFSFYFWYTIILYIKFIDKYRGEIIADAA